MRVFVLHESALVSDHRFGNEPILIGSGSDCAIRLPDPRIAHQHICLAPDGAGAWAVKVLESGNPLGARLNGTTIREEHAVKDLDEIGLGAYTLKLYFRLDQRDAAQKDGGRRESFALPPGGFVLRNTIPLKVTAERLIELAALAVDLAPLCETEQIAERVLIRALEVFGASAASLRVRQRTATGFEVIRSMDDKRRPIDPPTFANCLHDACTALMHRVCIPRSEDDPPCSAMIVPVVGSRGVLGSLYVQAPASASTFDEAAIDLLTAMAAALSPALERAIHRETRTFAESISHAINVSREIQDAVTPKAMPDWPDLQVAVYRRPGARRGRDYYDLMRLANRTAAMVCARIDCDGAALPRIMSEIRAAWRCACLHADPPHVFLRALNWLIGDAHAAWAAHVAAVWIEPDGGPLRYALAGDGLSLGILTADGTWRDLKLTNSPEVGRVRSFAYAARAVPLETGAAVAMISGGADLLVNAEGQGFTRQRVAECLADLAGTAINVMLSDLVQELDEFAGGLACPEDVTVMVARRTGA